MIHSQNLRSQSSQKTNTFLLTRLPVKLLELPSEAKALSKENHVWVDRKQQRVYADGYVAMQDGPLEMFACPIGTKEHESVIATLARSREMHAALLAIGAKPGTPVSFVPNFCSSNRTAHSSVGFATEIQRASLRQSMGEAGFRSTRPTST